MTFAARYPGICASCGDRIQPGDQIGYSVGARSITCADCLREDHRATTGYDLTVYPDCHCIHEGDCW